MLNLILTLSSVLMLLPVWIILYYYYQYIMNPNAPLRHEFLEGVAYGVLIWFFFCLVNLIIGIFKGKNMSNLEKVLTMLPMLVWGLLVLIMFLM